MSHQSWLRRIILPVILLASVQVAAETDKLKISPAGWQLIPSINMPTLNTTVLQLLTNPVSFHQRVVRVTGVLSVEPEDENIYLSKEFDDAFMPDYAISLRFPLGAEKVSAQFQGKYVLVTGYFKLEPQRAGVGVLEISSLEIVGFSRDSFKRDTKESVRKQR